MDFNNGFARSCLQKKWEKLRIKYRAAGMSEDAIQSMYDCNRQSNPRSVQQRIEMR